MANDDGSPKVIAFKPGECLFKEGDTPGRLYLIKRGAVAIRKNKAGGYVEIARIHQNQPVGELSFFDRKPRSASCIAIGNVEALAIEFDALDKIYKSVPAYLKTIMSCVADRLRRADDEIRKLQKNVITDESRHNQGADTAEDSSKSETPDEGTS